MKKIALVLLAGISLSQAKAQIQFGVKAGANFADVSKLDGSSSLTSFNAGVLVNIPLASSFSLQPEAYYSGQGVKGDGGEKLNLNYINIPVLIKYKLPVGVFVQTGPQFGILTSAKDKVGGTSTDVKDYFKSTDISWAGGVGYQLPMLPLGIDARYVFGLSKVGKSVDGSTEFDGKNGVFQVGLFYLFGGSSKK